MSYKTPEIVAKSAPKTSYAAGCPEKGRAGGPGFVCRQCERASQLLRQKKHAGGIPACFF